MFDRNSYKYILPPELIAESAVHPHHDARLMIIDRSRGTIEDESTFFSLDKYLGDDRVMFFNDSRVLRARIILTDIDYTLATGEKKNLKEGEIFYLKSITDNQFEALVRPGNRFKIGTTFHLWNYNITIISQTETGRVLQIDTHGSIQTLLTEYGSLPLPPYIKYEKEKEKDYQTAFAKKDGSVAAPTASLHFTQELLEKIANEKQYVTLHVGLGTFKGIDTADIRQYAIHSEAVEVSVDVFGEIYRIKSTKKKIVAVGTTACRTLESLPHLWKRLSQNEKNTIDANIREYWDTLTGELADTDWIHDITHDTHNNILFSTSIYITPGYTFHVIDDLITNFHLPESSLLVLVAAFIGHDATMKLYEKAIEKKYRFFSFGDGMYIRWK